ncbi:molybdopterin molybdotransferase MoeA [Bacillus sp. Marseille-P3661]|uniref:molybdopterin molybdotransferase MoeA n=1 Tax=Bacillus sp. Marseille-P3661 TaxID=1936234 RepID=UPI000C84FFA2|nr:gephyrin-like molybdotransferase Glp [Bacillus sp. Marseille-P3661]
MQFFKVKTVEETLNLIHHHVHPIGIVEHQLISDAFDRILAEDVIAAENVPNFRRSTVDGYAVKAADTYGSSESMPGYLNVVSEIKMGEEVTTKLMPGEAIQIPTGGMLPDHADSVIMIEHCEDISGLLNTYKSVAPGENVVGIGEDITEGSKLLTKGTHLRPQEIGALGSLGIESVNVYKKIKVGYLSSGDEIIPYETKNPQIGQVRDINGLTIGGMVKEWGYDFVYGGIVPDDFETFKNRALELSQQVDCLILSGGSSVGAKDYTTEVIQSLGDPGVYVHGISIKPGKPTILSQAAAKPIIGLPGHPASAMIIFKLFGQVILERLSGEVSNEVPTRMTAKIKKNIPSSPGRSDYIRVKLVKDNNEWWAEPILGKSGLLKTLVQSDGIVEIPSKNEGVTIGESVQVILLR